MKKLPKSIKSEMQKLSAIAPDSEWKNRNQQALLNELNIEEVSSRKTSSVVRPLISSFFNGIFSGITWRPVGVISVLLAVVIAGPGLAAVNAARASLPGDTLYTVKRTLERVELQLAFTEESKTEAKLNHLGNRLTELQRITQEEPPSPQREEKIVMALAELKKESSDVQERLKTLDKDDQDIVKLAKAIDEKTSGYKDSLKAAVESLHEDVAGDTEEDIDQALSTVQDVALGALDVLVEKHEGGDTEVSDEELKERVQKQLETTKGLIASLKSRVVQSVLEENSDTETPEEQENAEEETEEEEPAEEADQESEDTEEEAGESKEAGLELEGLNPAAIQRLLDEELLPGISYAEELLELQDYAEVLEVLAETKQQIDEASENIRIQKQQPVEEEPAEEVEESDESAEESQEVTEESEEETVNEEPPEEE